MIPTPGAFLRVGVILLLAVVLQISGFAQMRILGASANLIPLAVAGVAFFGGSVPGAASGFAAGLLLDLALGHTAGTSSLVLTAVGYGAGRYREVRDPAHGLAPMAFGLAATAGYLLALGGVTFMLGVEASVSLLVLRDVVVTVLLNGLLALPVFWLLGRTLRGALVSDPLARGRRQRTREAGPIGLRGLEV
ncbi:MAG: rod shape-determining protein MreD [Thermoleophilaceae bacterium]|jgi:rod shape-determining protein MreD|nr:rod shape-determining protein MreD [Thermoleophilaceae bacterium]